MSKGAKIRGAEAVESVGRLCRATRQFDGIQVPDRRVAAAKAVLAALQDIHALRDDLGRIVREAEKEIKRRVLSLQGDLESACHTRKWALRGTWPQFFVDDAVEVSIDERNGVAKVAGQRVDLDVNAIVEVLNPIVRGLVPRSFSEQDFLEAVGRAVDASAKPGGSAAMMQVYRQLVIDMQPTKWWRDARAETFSPLSLEQLRARFSRMLASNLQLKDGRRLAVAPPLDPKDGIFLWQPAEKRFGWVGRLQLVEEVRV